jgi:hypothetical protein
MSPFPVDGHEFVTPRGRRPRTLQWVRCPFVRHRFRGSTLIVLTANCRAAHVVSPPADPKALPLRTGVSLGRSSPLSTQIVTLRVRYICESERSPYT